MTLTGHKDVVEDVAWHAKLAHMFGSCSDDGSVMLWDNRDTDGTRPSHHVKAAHGAEADVNSLAFNPVNEHLFCSGGSDNVVNIWDIRKLGKKVHALGGAGCHRDDIISTQWMSETKLGSVGKDRKVMIWDLSRIGEEQNEEEAADGPPELLFIHSGHCDTISDFGWSGYDDFLAASVSEDNMLQVWQLSPGMFEDEEDDLGDDDLEDGDEEEEEDGSRQGPAKKARSD